MSQMVLRAKHCGETHVKIVSLAELGERGMVRAQPEGKGDVQDHDEPGNICRYERRGAIEMTSPDEEKESLVAEFEEREAGVGDLMELYDLVEAVYVAASASLGDSQVGYTSDSTNLE